MRKKFVLGICELVAEESGKKKRKEAISSQITILRYLDDKCMACCRAAGNGPLY